MIANIKKIEGSGFLAFKMPFGINLEDLEGSTVLIDGINKDDPLSQSNGAGKSCLLEAINWILYGE